jgi:hypothetical protein
VVVDLEYLLLVGRQLGHGSLERADDGVGVGSEGDARRALLDGFHGVFDLSRMERRIVRMAAAEAARAGGGREIKSGGGSEIQGTVHSARLYLFTRRRIEKGRECTRTTTNETLT